MSFTIKYSVLVCTRISCTSQPDRMMRETCLKSRRTPKPVHAGVYVGGVRVTEMNRDTLRKHVRAMRLKPKGPLKADLQQCLCDHLSKSSCDGGFDKGGDSVPLEGGEGGSGAKEREETFEDCAGGRMDVAGAEVEDRHNEAESMECDRKVKLRDILCSTKSTSSVCILFTNNLYR